MMWPRLTMQGEAARSGGPHGFTLREVPVWNVATKLSYQINSIRRLFRDYFTKGA
jgi:hypothetical protein